MREIVRLFLLSLFIIPNGVFGALANYQGTILDENDEPLIGVNIASVSDATKGCSTDLEGKFTDCKLPDNKVRVSYVGYKTQTIDLQESGNNIKLEPDIEELNEVQTIGNKSAMSQQARDCIASGGKMETNGEDVAACVCPADKPLNGNRCGGDDSTEPEGEVEETPTDTEPVVATDPDGNNGNGGGNNGQGQTNKNDKPKKDDLADKQKAYKDAKEKEQSTANKTLTALTTAATGIGGMELAMGISEKKADEEAESDMKAYLETFRCKYGNSKSYKFGPDEIELPGGNDEKLMSMRSEYVALAADLKERKEALGMKPGIEAEKIYDKAEMGLYDDENVGITGGNYASLYRAQALGSEEDQAKLDAQHKEAKNRMIAGGVLAGAGVLGGIIGNSAINGKLGEAIKKLKDKKAAGTIGEETKKALKVESDALESLQKCMAKAGFQNSDKLSFDNFFASAISVKSLNCSKDMVLIGDKKAKDIQASDVFLDSADETEIFEHLTTYFHADLIGKMIGSTLTDDSTEEEIEKAKNVLKKSIASAKKKIETAAKADEASAAKSSSSTSSTGSGILSGVLGGGDSEGGGLSGLASTATGLLGGGDGEGGGLGGIASKAKGLLGGGDGEGGGNIMSTVSGFLGGG